MSSVSRFQIIRENLHPFDVITLAFLKEELPNLPTGRFSNGKISRDMAKTHKRTYKKRSWCKACAYAKRLNTNLCDETLKHPACTVGWVVQLCHSWLSRGRQPEFPIGEIPLGQYSCKKKKNCHYFHSKQLTSLVPLLFYTIVTHRATVLGK